MRYLLEYLLLPRFCHGYFQYSGVRQKASIMQSGESPLPIKPSQQSVLSLGVETARSDLSVGKGVCEPKCECVKPNSPVKLI